MQIGNNDNQGLCATLDELWKNWTFRLSLSSNELFHSNILQYLAEFDNSAAPTKLTIESSSNCNRVKIATIGAGLTLDPQQITKPAVQNLWIMLAGDAVPKDVQRLIDTAKRITVRREWNKMDLAILVSNDELHGMEKPLFALEVKVKSYPTQRQLRCYRERLDAEWGGEDAAKPKFTPPLFLLTGMGDDITGGIEGVHSIDFSDVDQRIGQSVGSDSVIREEYRKLCGLLHKLFAELSCKLQENATIGDIYRISSILEPYRLHSIWWKLWASYLDKSCRGSQDWNKELQSDPDFTQVGMLGVFWSSSNRGTRNTSQHTVGRTNKSEINIGVEIQGKSMRLFLNVVDHRLGSPTESRQRTEYALLKLCATNGVFACNPRIEAYRQKWKESNKTGVSYTNDPLKNLPEVNVPKTPADCFDLDIGGWGRSAGKFIPCLHGYANGDGNGFADFRLSLNADCKLSDIVLIINRVLTENLYSNALDTSKSLLESVVNDFACNPDKWLRNYANISNCN